VVGICNSKNHEEMLQKLTALENSHLYLTETSFKTLPLACYGEKFLKLARFASPDPLEVLNVAAISATSDDLLVVTGSLYLVSSILQQILPKK
jgi:folylpolyglutamate synthase/dihydropteroate synthase